MEIETGVGARKRYIVDSLHLCIATFSPLFFKLLTQLPSRLALWIVERGMEGGDLENFGAKSPISISVDAKLEYMLSNLRTVRDYTQFLTKTTP